MDSKASPIEFDISDYKPDTEPFYIDVNGETEIFKAAYKERIPVMLKGPTGCGKSRFVERMAYELNQELTKGKKKDYALHGIPLVTVPCHEDLKQSTKQRFVAIDFDYPPAKLERKIVAHESDIDENIADYLVDIGGRVRNLKGKGLDEGASTRLLINAGKL